MPLRPVTTFVADCIIFAERATVVLGRDVALRDTVVAAARPETVDVVVGVVPDDAAEFTRTTRLLFARDVAPVAASDVAAVTDTVDEPRGFGACSANAGQHSANTDQKASEYLQKSATRLIKFYISLFAFYHFLDSLINTQFIQCNNLPHFLPSHPNDAPPT